MLSKLLLLSLCFVIALPTYASVKVTEENPSAFPSGKGFAVVRVVTNTASFNSTLGLNNAWTGMTVSGAKNSQAQLPIRISASRRTSQVFAGFLPEGRHRLKSLLFLTSQSADLERFDLEFEVRDSQISNLGTIVFQPTGNQGYVIVQHEKHDDVRQMLRVEFPMLSKLAVAESDQSFRVASSAKLDGASVPPGGALNSVPRNAATGAVQGITVTAMQLLANSMLATDELKEWSEVTDPSARLALAKSHTYSLNNLQQLQSGEILAASNLGQILLRDDVNGWRRFDIGDARELTAIHASNREHIVAGGEEGLLAATTDGGATWRILGGPTSAGLIVHVTESKGEWFVLSMWKGELILHSTRDLDSGVWNELMRAPGAAGFGRAVQSYAAMHNERFFIPTGEKQLLIYDVKTRGVSSVRTPDYIWSMKFFGDQLLASGMSLYASSDFGSGWAKFSSPCGNGQIVSTAFVSSQQAYLLCRKSGALVGSTSLMGTINGGKAWSNVLSETPALASQIFSADGKVFYMDIINRIYVSSDEGKSWRLDR